MANPADKLTPKPKTNGAESSGAVELRVNPPQVRVGSPKVDVKIDAPQLNMDSTQFADAIRSLSDVMQQLAQQQVLLLREMAETRNLMNELAKNTPNVQVAAPKVTMPARPREFDVAFVEDDDGIVGMRIKANLPN